jgi:hypothetical protein
MPTDEPRAGGTAEDLRCPTCGARQTEPTDTCRRCKSDLRLLRAALEAYQRHRLDTLAALDAGRLEAALRHARRCHELRPGPESHRLLAVCQLLRGDWPAALAEGLRVRT